MPAQALLKTFITRPFNKRPPQIRYFYYLCPLYLYHITIYQVKENPEKSAPVFRLFPTLKYSKFYCIRVNKTFIGLADFQALLADIGRKANYSFRNCLMNHRKVLIAYILFLLMNQLVLLFFSYHHSYLL